jgi:transposase, IS5 family
MLGRLNRQSSLFFFAFGNQAALIKDDLLEPIDRILNDEELIDLVSQALGSRCAKSKVTGRRGIAADRLLRCCVLKHIKSFSLRELQRELRCSLVYRHFTRFDEAPIPNYATFSRCFAALGDDLTRKINLRVVQYAQQQKVAPGRKLRTDTTVVETNIHHPTDSSLLADGVRVITRTLSRIADECAPAAIKIANHARSVKHRVLEINRTAKSRTQESEAKMKNCYAKLVGITKGLVKKAKKVIQDLHDGVLPVTGDALEVMGHCDQLDHFVPLVQKVIDQAKARVFGGDTHVGGKILSLFEPTTQVIRKGKVAKPTEFGRLVRIDEAENGIVSNYDVKDGNPADVNEFIPAVSQHKEFFGHAPHMATGDRGFFSAENERQAHNLGVHRVAVPARGTPSQTRRTLQKKRWFQRAMRWRSGIEARIATLKHRFQMARACYKGDTGFKRHVGWSIIANNLVSIARVQARETAAHASKNKAAA